MAITQEELDSFNEFVTEHLRNGKTDLTLEQCLSNWREVRELWDDVRVGLAEIRAGQGVSLEECKRQLDEYIRELDKVESRNG